MKVSHLCVNYGAPLFHELFLALNRYDLVQNVFYPRNQDHIAINTNNTYKVYSPLVLNLLTRISFQRKRRILRKYYEPIFLKEKPDIIHAHTLFSDGSLANHYYREKNN